jgi:hypothetical protein
MYNSTQEGMKAQVFKTLVEVCQQEGQIDILIQRARAVEQESSSWNLSTEEKKDLYLSVAQSLDAVNDEGAFQIMHAYLKQFESEKTASNLSAIQTHARRCVILAIKTPNVINFEELLDLKAIKALEGVSFFLTHLFAEKQGCFQPAESVHQH